MRLSTKEEALDALEASRADWLAVARGVARVIARSGPITVNDVRKKAPPLPDGVDGRVFGAVLRGPEWKFEGYVKSTRRTSHGRPVARYRLVG